MPAIRYLQIDVFAERAGGGNPLGVVFGADAWTATQMQQFAAWMNLVETTFVLRPRETLASYRLRIFTPSREIPFAGHPTVGSAHAALDIGHVVPREGLLLQECAAGVLPIRVDGEGATRRLFVQAPAAQILRQGVDDPALHRVIDGLDLGALAPAFVEGGRRWWLAELASETALRNWQPDHAAIATLARESDSLGLCVFARADPFDVKSRAAAIRSPTTVSDLAPTRRAEDNYDLVVRAFPAGVGIVEDPASGAANGLIAAYIAQREPAGRLARGYRVSQGREMNHDATIDIRIDADARVWVGGRAWTVIDGVLKHPIAG